MGVRASVIVPSLDGYRGGAVPLLLESVRNQSVTDIELLVIEGVSPQGKAINMAAERAQGEVLIILDDDACLANPQVFQRLLDTLDASPDIGMAGASIVVPPDATPFQQRAARQFPRFNMPEVAEVTDSDMACHGCCAIPKKVFEEIGGEREDIPRGLDPDLRLRLREHGYRVVLVPGAVAFHPLPNGWRNLCRIYFRNGYGSAYAMKFQPDSVLDTYERVSAENFEERRSWMYRVARFPFRLLLALVSLQFIRFVAYSVYAHGYVWGLLTARDTLKPTTAPANSDTSTS